MSFDVTFFLFVAVFIVLSTLLGWLISEFDSMDLHERRFYGIIVIFVMSLVLTAVLMWIPEKAKAEGRTAEAEWTS